MTQRATRCLTRTLCIAAVASAITCGAAHASSPVVAVRPQPYAGAIANPLAGFMLGDPADAQEWATLARTYIKWSDIEETESDGLDKILAHCDARWSSLASRGIKAVPRVYLNWPPDQDYWPADMATGDFASAQFEARALRLVERLGQAWDNDPRVAFIEMGVIGQWGEQHDPDVSPRMQRLLGDAFTKAFRNKKVLVRHPWDFTAYAFGIYWDSWAWYEQMNTHGRGIEKLGDKWTTAVIGGETGYGLGRYKVQPGDDPTDTVTDIVHRSYLLDSIRNLHNTYLGWVSRYDASEAAARAGAAEVQSAMGYRFEIGEFRYPAAVAPGEPMAVSFDVRNVGSAAFYYRWPVELSLLDKVTRLPVWTATLESADVTAWLPGSKWSKSKQAYSTPPKTTTVTATVCLPMGIPAGEYLIALSILDGWSKPSVPAVRFAVANCLEDGRCPLGVVGVGKEPLATAVDPSVFSDIARGRPVYFSGRPE